MGERKKERYSHNKHRKIRGYRKTNKKTYP
jgi:hypothetical protein